MQLRDHVEHAIRRWHVFEEAQGGDPVIDYDCAPPTKPVDPYPDRFTALDGLVELRNQVDDDTALAAQLDAHLTYLRALLGEQTSLEEYVQHTQRCSARGWSPDYVDHRGDLARSVLDSLDIAWDADTWRRIRALEEKDSPVADPSAAIRKFADEFEPTVRELTGTSAEFNLSIENVEVDAYWSYWLDGTGRDARLRINLANASLTPNDAYRFALHEVLGHALQYASLADHAESHEVDWPRLLSIHCPHQVLFEGLGQVLPLIADPDNELVRARVRLDHYLQLVRAELHILINSGESAAACRDHALRRVPFWSSATIARDLFDRSANPQLRTYLWAYPAGIDWFVNLHEAGGARAAEVLHEAYQHPLDPSELRALWPAGPAIGGNQ
ncbi:MAG: hypothetical protein LC799_24370 [Actinobacteria bacterium]|nr:hypothetical protein [Actinomycetota bacterium]